MTQLVALKELNKYRKNVETASVLTALNQLNALGLKDQVTRYDSKWKAFHLQTLRGEVVLMFTGRVWNVLSALPDEVSHAICPLNSPRPDGSIMIGTWIMNKEGLLTLAEWLNGN